MARKTNEKVLQMQEENALPNSETEMSKASVGEMAVSDEAQPDVFDELPLATTQEENTPIGEPLSDTDVVFMDIIDDAENANLSAKVEKPKATKRKSKKTDEPAKGSLQKPKSARQSFYSIDFRTIDRNLSPEQEQEWNSIYASFRSRSILTGTVIGVDDHTFDVTGGDGITQRKTVRSLVIIGYRVKVMIPETEIWSAGEEYPRYAIRGMVGAKVDYVIMSVDRENDCAIASRRMAMTKQRRHTLQTTRVGQGLVTCDTILVAHKVMLVNCGGFDLMLTQRDLSYTAIADLRNEYKPGMELQARLLDVRDGKPVISVKEVNPNPFDGAEQRHPVGCRRQAIIEGKYGGGVFCRLPDDTTCLCLYSNNHYDNEFDTGDTVLIHITEFDYNRKLIYGRIVGKR